MRTNGDGNDALMVLVPVTVTLVLGVILFGGSTHTLEAVSPIVADAVYEVMKVVSGIL